MTCSTGCSGSFDNASVNIGGVTMDVVVGSNNVTLRGPDAPDTTVIVTPSAAIITSLAGTRQFSAEALDINGDPLSSQPTFIWSESSGGTVATINGSGLAAAVANGGPITITATIQGTTTAGTASLTVQEGVDFFWTGAGVGDGWSTPDNWIPAGPPTAGSDVLINVDGARVNYDLPSGTVAANDITIGGTATLVVGNIDFVTGGILTVLPTAILETDGTNVQTQLDNQGTWNVLHNTATLFGHGIGALTAHTNSGLIQMNVPLWIDLEEANFTNTGVMVANDIMTINIFGGDNPTFTNSGTGEIWIAAALNVQGDGTFNFEAGRLDQLGGDAFQFTLDGVTANFTPNIGTNRRAMTLINGALANGPGILTSNNSEQPLILNNSAIGAPLVNEDSIEVVGSSAFIGTTSDNNGVISGTGSLDVSGTTFTNPGVLSPAGIAIGQLTLVGDITQSATSLIDLQFGGTTAAPNFDQLQIFGSVDFTGTTIRDFQWDSYVPANDAVLEIITCSDGCSGTFDNSTINIDGVTLTVTVNAFNVQLRGPGAP
jgi:hypothetical protein